MTMVCEKYFLIQMKLLNELRFESIVYKFPFLFFYLYLKPSPFLKLKQSFIDNFDLSPHSAVGLPQATKNKRFSYINLHKDRLSRTIK